MWLKVPGAKLLADLMCRKDCSLKSLELAWNLLGPEGAVMLAKGLVGLHALVS